MKTYDGEHTGRIPGLDALRFLGALSVVLLHVGSSGWFAARGWTAAHPLVSGETGVVLFYVLSGFLITSLAIDEVTASGAFDVCRFFIRRALRLFPLYYLALAMIFLVSLAGWTRVTPRGWLHGLTYTFNFVPKADYNGLIGSFHTLGTEEQFYLAYGLLFFLLVGRRSLQLGLAARLHVLVVVLAACTLANDRLEALLSPFDERYFLERWMPVAADPLLIGALAAAVLKHPMTQAAVRRLHGRTRLLTALHLSLLGASAVLFVGLATWHESKAMLSVGFALLVVDLYVFRGSRLARLGDLQPLAYLGKISYGIYVWQSVINGTGSSSRWIASPWLSTALVFVVSVASFELFEQRFLRLKPYGRHHPRPDGTAGATR